MKKLLAAIAGLIGVDSVALGAEGDADEATINQINNLKTVMTGAAALRKSVCDVLALGAETDDSRLAGALLGMAAKARAYDPLKVQYDAMALAAETDKRQKLIDQGLADGKLTAAMVENWAKTQDAAALSAYLQHAPKVIDTGKLNPGAPPSDAVALSAEEREIIAQAGIKEEDYLRNRPNRQA